MNIEMLYKDFNLELKPSKDASKHLYSVYIENAIMNIKSYELFEGVVIVHNLVKNEGNYIYFPHKKTDILHISYIFNGKYEAPLKNNELKTLDCNTLSLVNFNRTSINSRLPPGVLASIQFYVDSNIASKELKNVLKQIDIQSINNIISLYPLSFYSSKQLAQIFTDMRNYFDLGPQYLRIKFLEFLIILDKFFLEKSPYFKKSNLTEEIKYYISCNCDLKNLSIAHLCKVFQISPSKIQRDFSHAYSESIYQYIKKQKISKAITLLTQGDRKIDAIAHEIGYMNASKFSESFKKITGKSPSEYKKNLKSLE